MAHVSDDQYRTLALFRSTLRRFQKFSEDAARACGLPPQQHQALLAVRGFAGDSAITVGELAEQLQVRHHSAVGLADRLVAQDLVERSRTGEDRRQVRLALTKHGEEVLASLAKAHRAELRRLAPQLKELLAALDEG
ncbi:MAG: MarR family transcriptional regulator [Acidobacteriota bacterium]